MTDYNHHKVISFFALFVFIVFVVFAGISPLLGFYIPLIFLAVNFGKNRLFRVSIASIAIFSCIFMVSSRNYMSGSIKDDFQNIYFPVYQRMAAGQSIFYDQFSNGLEFLLPLYFKITHYLFNLTHPQDVMASVTALCLIPFYIWLEKYGMENVSDSKKSLCVASSLGLMVYAVTTQNMRQAISCVFLLFAITYFRDKRWFLFLIYFMLAFVAHTTAIVVLAIFIILMSDNSYRKKTLALTALFASLFFNIIIGIIISHNLLGAATYKLMFYTKLSGGASLDIGYLKFFFIMIFTAPLFFNTEENKYKSLIFYGTFIYFVLIPIPVISHRLLLLMVAFMNGYLMFLSFYRIANVYRVIFIGYCIYRLLKQGPYFTLGDEEQFMDLWFSYPWIGSSLFYYLT
ncbi:TPA: EpsG family protein [Klebsiella pneumoniae]